MTQPEALRLADALNDWSEGPDTSVVLDKAAAELRRLHAELERCKQVCAATSEAWRKEAALAEPVEPDPWGAGYEAGYEAGVARRPAQPVQDHFPDATKMVQDADLWSAGYAAGYAAGMEECPAEPVQEPYAWMAVGGTIWRHKFSEDDLPLYTAPRVPLTEWQINDLMANIDPEDVDSWSFRQGVYATEKHHGVRP